MIPKQIIADIQKIESFIKLKKERIEKLQRLAKLGKNADLVSEYDLIIKNQTNVIDFTLDSKDLITPQSEQVNLHIAAAVRNMAKGLKQSICEADKQIELINNSIEDDNIKIENLKNRKSAGGTIC